MQNQKLYIISDANLDLFKCSIHSNKDFFLLYIETKIGASIPLFPPHIIFPLKLSLHSQL